MKTERDMVRRVRPGEFAQIPGVEHDAFRAPSPAVERALLAGIGFAEQGVAAWERLLRAEPQEDLP